MARVLFISTSTNNTDTVIDSLKYLGEHEIELVRYDKRWNEVCQQAILADPNVRTYLQMGIWPPPETREAYRQRVSMDAEILKVAATFKPHSIMYISAWEGLFVPTHETLKKLGETAPVTHLCFDGSDPPWWPQMKVFEEKGLFALTVNIDGGPFWPGAPLWSTLGRPECPKIAGLTTLTPVDPRYFEGVQVPFNVRPYAIGYAGNAGGWIRSQLVNQMQKHKGHVFTYRGRDDHMGSYRNYCDFLRYCRVVISVPFTGSNATTHVKGRVVEAGWAGAALLEWKNDATRHWFTPRHDFWEYDSIEDCMDAAEWLAAHPRLCEEMAQALRTKVVGEHHPRQIWNHILNWQPPKVSKGKKANASSHPSSEAPGAPGSTSAAEPVSLSAAPE